MKGDGVKIFWVESGSNPSCEQQLKIDVTKPTVLAFKSQDTHYEIYSGSFTAENVLAFVQTVKSRGLSPAKTLPYGGVKLMGEL